MNLSLQRGLGVPVPGWGVRRRRGVLAACALALWLFPACQADPARFPPALEAALASRDPDRVERLLSRDSRALFRAMLATKLDPKGPFALDAPRVPVRLMGVQKSESGVVLTVEASGIVRDWVLVPEAGQYRLDLLATSARRPWSSGGF